MSQKNRPRDSSSGHDFASQLNAGAQGFKQGLSDVGSTLIHPIDNSVQLIQLINDLGLGSNSPTEEQILNRAIAAQMLSQEVGGLKNVDDREYLAGYILAGIATGEALGALSNGLKAAKLGKIATKGSSSLKFGIGNMPKNPGQLVKNGWKDVTPEGMAKNTASREFLDPSTGMKVRFEPGKPGAKGFEGQDHYHVYNPNSTGKGDYYLDINGDPVPKGSKGSHILP